MIAYLISIKTFLIWAVLQYAKRSKTYIHFFCVVVFCRWFSSVSCRLTYSSYTINMMHATIQIIVKPIIDVWTKPLSDFQRHAGLWKSVTARLNMFPWTRSILVNYSRLRFALSQTNSSVTCKINIHIYLIF